ncbi:peptide-methionine (S)-S-oxide reductase MsrA [Haliangium sp.]|uniref:peptide-methionine (S)-S-oxide reductase MsrA n=1 Tax=Haliangium sp. TaxID=2663208 RepID=UPI003D09782E
MAGCKPSPREVPPAEAGDDLAFGLGKGFPRPVEDLPRTPGPAREAVFAGGCFWCVEAVFEAVDGVSEVISGYAGGAAETANYRAVSAGDSGHAEVVNVVYDPGKVSYGALLRVFFVTHDPTQKNRQGPDVGTQYRSAIFFADADEKRVAEAYIRQLDAAGVYDAPIVTTLEPLEAFYPAEDYHQDYARENPGQPYIRFHAQPKVEKLHKVLPEMVEGQPERE